MKNKVNSKLDYARMHAVQRSMNSTQQLVDYPPVIDGQAMTAEQWAELRSLDMRIVQVRGRFSASATSHQQIKKD